MFLGCGFEVVSPYFLQPYYAALVAQLVAALALVLQADVDGLELLERLGIGELRCDARAVDEDGGHGGGFTCVRLPGLLL